MNTMEISVSSNVSISDRDELFFVLIDDEAIGYTKSEENAQFFIEDIAYEVENETLYENGGRVNVQVFCEKLTNKITISYQLLGTFYNSSIYPAHIVEYKRIHQLFQKK